MVTQDIPVRCLLNRSWNISTREWDGDWVNGTLIEISTQTAQDDYSKHVPVGIVLLDDNTFQCVPMEFIIKTTN